MMRRQGMTLVEVLVAMLVFALVAAAAALSLRLAVDAREQLSDAEHRIAELETARLLIKEDLAQYVPRRIRDEFGESFGPAFLGGVETRTRPAVAGEILLAAFVRSGWINPGFEAPRSSLQFVEYLQRDSTLIRRTRPFLDDARGQPRVERVLIEKAGDVSLRFLGTALAVSGQSDADAGWLPGWPLPGSGAADAPPRAVSISLTTERYGSLRMAFWIGETGGPALPQADAETETDTDTDENPEDSAGEAQSPEDGEPDPPSETAIDAEG